MKSFEISPFKPFKGFSLIRSMSSKNFGTIFSYSIYNLRKNKIKSANTPNKTFQRYSLMKSNKKDINLSNDSVYFTNIKNLKVRNFYETILKNSCREKEPKTILLKNAFKQNNKRSFLYKSKKDVNNIFIRNELTEKKSRTTNNLPFIQYSHNLNLKNKNNYNNNCSNNNIFGDIENKNINSIYNIHGRNKANSLLYKDNIEKDKAIIQNFRHILSKKYSIKNKTLKLRNDKLIFGNNEFKTYKLIDFKEK